MFRARGMGSYLSLADFETDARRRLPRPLFGYVSSTAEDGQSWRNDRQAFGQLALLPRTLVDVTQRSTRVSLFGREYAAPVGIAPMGLEALVAYRGDLILARAAAEANLPMVVSGSSLIPLEAFGDLADHVWFQAYLPGEIAAVHALLDRVQAAGYRTLVVTVDIAAAANRENYARVGFSTPFRLDPRLAWDTALRPRWLMGVWLRTLVCHGMPHFENSSARRGAPILSAKAVRDFSARGRLTWDTIQRVRAHWRGTLVLKGILSPQDAARAAQCGVDGIIVSNHGGRQLDAAVAPLQVLTQVVQSAGTIPIMLDSGVRRGTDVLKALALGARFTFIGRPFLYSAAVGGQAGIRRALQLITGEIDRDMALVGINRLAELDRSFIRSFHDKTTHSGADPRA